MYVSLGSPGCVNHADCPGEGMYCEEGSCIYRAPEEMSHCDYDSECDESRGYYCVANLCDKLPPEYYPTTPKPVPPAPTAPPKPSAPASAVVSGAKPDLTFVVVAGSLAAGLAYFVGRQS